MRKLDTTFSRTVAFCSTECRRASADFCKLPLMLWGLLLTFPVFAVNPTGDRYFEGEMLIEKAGGSETCQRHAGKTKEVQISWQEGRNGSAPSIAGWIVFAGGAPGKLSGPTPGQMTVTTNYFDTHLNTPTTLALAISDGVATGTLHETPASLGFGESMCYWLEAKLTLTEKTSNTDVRQKLLEHAAWYKAHAHESRGDYYARYYQSAEAASAYDGAISAADGVLPETRTYFKGLLNYTARLYSDAKNYERAAERYQRLLDITIRQFDSGAEDPDLYRGWIRLATYLHLAKRTDSAIPVIERAERLEPKAKDVDLDERLLRLRLQGNIYIAEKMFDKAQACMRDEVALATTEAGTDDLRTFEARVQAARVYLPMKDKPRFEEAFVPLAKELTSRFGDAHELARNSNVLLGRYFYSADDYTKARPWLESAFRGYRMLSDSTAQAIRQDEEAKEMLAALIDIYIRQGIVPKNFLDRVKAGQASLDDLPFGGPSTDNNGFANRMISPAEWNKLLSR